MPMLPVSAFIALVLAWLALRTLVEGERPLLAGFLAICALQALGVALALGYGVTAIRPVLPITATLIPPLAWITFRAALFAPASWRTAAPHLAVPLVSLVCRLVVPEALDVVVPGVFAGYGIAMLATLRRTPDLPHASVAAGGLPALLWRLLGWLLLASALSDVLIAIAHLAGRPEWTGWIVTVFSSVTLLCIGLLVSRPAAMGDAEVTEPAPAREPATENAAEDAAILERVDGLLSSERVFLDPGLTLARLARRLGLPEKRLSTAINRAAGENVSRYVNRRRIEHACRLMRDGTSVTSAMLESGFNTKSNFNREFSRVKGTSPAAWLRQPEVGLDRDARHGN